jgi:hypothetical protein
MMLLPPRCAAGWPTLPMGIPMACGEHWSPGRLFPEAQRGTIAHFCAHL